MKENPLLILASASPRRLSLLSDIGIVPDRVVPSEIDETPLRGEHPHAMAKRLAFEKGKLIAAQNPQALVLAADTVVACGRRVLPKAETDEDVRRCLSLLQGRRHHVFTATALFMSDGSVAQRMSDSVVIFDRLDDKAIDAYVECKEGIGKAGGYAIQGRVALFVKYIGGSYSGIVGLPLNDVAHLLARAGYKL